MPTYKMMVDGKTIVSFKCTRNDFPKYIEKYRFLKGVEVVPANQAEFLKFKRTRKKKKNNTTPEQLVLK